MEKEYRYKISRHSWGKVMLWETVIQSPYSMEVYRGAGQEADQEENYFGIRPDGDWLNW